jgi:hypothetical protein
MTGYKGHGRIPHSKHEWNPIQIAGFAISGVCFVIVAMNSDIVTELVIDRMKAAYPSFAWIFTISDALNIPATFTFWLSLIFNLFYYLYRWVGGSQSSKKLH